MAEQHSIQLPSQIKDETGKRYGRWIVLGYAGPRKTASGKRKSGAWLCLCDCGNESEVSGNLLRLGKSKSCGCLANDLTRARYTGHDTVEYHIWHKMIDRCENPESTVYHRYGGRGISVCERWHVYEDFLNDMGSRPSIKHSLDRINNDGDYEPSNCRWATIREQARNRSDNLRIEYQGITLTLVEWSEKTGIPQATIGYRLRMGWSVDDALSRPPRLGISFSTRTDQRKARHLCTEQ